MFILHFTKCSKETSNEQSSFCLSVILIKSFIISIFFLSVNCSDHFTSCTYDGNYKKGFSIFFMPPRNSYNDTDFTEHLTRMKHDGINSLYLSPSFFQQNITSDSIYSTSNTLPDSLLRQAIINAKNAGIDIVLKPHVNCIDNTPRYKISPVNYVKWFQSYRDFILHYYELSKQFNLKSFVIGTELDNVAENTLFLKLCDSLRNDSDIEIIYACSYNHFVNTTIWNHIDIMGINVYFNLDNTLPPSEAVIHETWSFWLNTIDQMSIIHNKPIILTEAGFMSRENAAKNPGDFSGNPICDERIQKICYESLLSQACSFTSIRGIYFWQWELGSKGRFDSCDYTPRDKPAEDVIRTYWNN